MLQDKKLLFQLSLAASVIGALAILSFPSYFFYVPFSSGVNTVTVLGFMTMIGWISLLVAPPLFVGVWDMWSKRRSYWLMAAVLLYPVATVLVKISSLVLYGEIWASYLVTYPILFFLEWLLPAAYVYIAIRLRRRDDFYFKADI
jgi:hypothetical protein